MKYSEYLYRNNIKKNIYICEGLHSKIRPVFDIDGDVEKCEKVGIDRENLLPNVKMAIKKIFIDNFNVTLENHDFSICSSHSENKISYHIVLHRYQTTMEDMKTAIENSYSYLHDFGLVKNEKAKNINGQEYTKPYNLMDVRIYTKLRFFRIPMTTKFGEERHMIPEQFSEYSNLFGSFLNRNEIPISCKKNKVTVELETEIDPKKDRPIGKYKEINIDDEQV